MSVSKDIETHAYNIELLLNGMKEEVKSTQVILEDQRKLEQAARDAAAKSNAELDAVTKANASERGSIEAATATLNGELEKLQVELRALVERKSGLMLENNGLEEKNRQLKLYESKAWKLLEAKDKELVQRELILDQKDSYSSRPKTLLPPV